jgi:replicative DNA helicase
MKVISEQNLYDERAERQVLSILLKEGKLLCDVSNKLNETHFFKLDHRSVFKSICSVLDDGLTTDVMSVYFAVDKVGVFINEGGYNYLIDLVAETMSTDNLSLYVNKLVDLKARRELYAMSQYLQTEVTDDTKDIRTLINKAETMLCLAGEQTGDNVNTSIDELTDSEKQRVRDIFNKEVKETSIPTGYSELTKKTGGFESGQLIVVAAGTGVGKSAFAINLALNIAKYKHIVLLFTIEMTKKEVYRRLVSVSGSMPVKNFKRTAEINEDDCNYMTGSMDFIRNYPIYINDNGGITLSELRMQAKNVKNKHGLDLVIIDYLQLVTTGRKNENKHQEISEITRKLKILAKELDVPVIALSQLNREYHKRNNKRPQLSDLRESGSIEQDADIVMLLFRDERFRESPNDYRDVEVIIAKNRNGATGSVFLEFIPEHTKFITKGSI